MPHLQSSWNYNGLAKIIDGTINLATDELKIMLCSGYSYGDHAQFVSSAPEPGGSNATADELDVEGYERGFGGSGRKPVTVNVTVNSDLFGTGAPYESFQAQIEVHLSDVTWTGIEPGTMVGQAVLINERTSDDDSFVIAVWVFDEFATVISGGAFTLDFDAVGPGNPNGFGALILQVPPLPEYDAGHDE